MVEPNQNCLSAYPSAIRYVIFINYDMNNFWCNEVSKFCVYWCVGGRKKNMHWAKEALFMVLQRVLRSRWWHNHLKIIFLLGILDQILSKHLSGHRYWRHFSWYAGVLCTGSFVSPYSSPSPSLPPSWICLQTTNPAHTWFWQRRCVSTQRTFTSKRHCSRGTREEGGHYWHLIHRDGGRSVPGGQGCQCGLHRHSTCAVWASTRRKNWTEPTNSEKIY